MRAVVVVGKDVARTLPQLWPRVPSELRLFFVDDGSSDQPSVPQRVTLLRHPVNRGYGAAQRTGYRAALAAGAERVALLHGDAQYDADDVLGLLDALDQGDIALGSRFLAPDRGAIIPWWRRLANRGLTTFGNLALGLSLTEMHTGARAYRAELLGQLPLDDFSDDYLFDQQLIAAAARRGARFVERPVRCRYDDEVQSIALGRSIRYGLGCLRTVVHPP